LECGASAPPCDRIHAATRSVTEPETAFVEFLDLFSQPYAAKIEKNSLFYFFQPCYSVYSWEASNRVISFKNSQSS